MENGLHQEQLLRELQALRERLNVMDAFMDHSPAVAFMKDEEGRYVYVSKMHKRYVGREPADQLGKTDDELWPPEAAAQIRVNDAAVLLSGKMLEVVETLPRSDGLLRSFLAFKFPFRDASGKLLLGGMAVDITERIQAEEKQREYAQRLQVLSRRLVEVQEEDRRRLALEIHDEIGQLLTSLRFTLEASRDASGRVTETKFREARALLEETMTRLRELSFDLRPALLDHLGLTAAVSWLIERLAARMEMRVNLKHSGLEARLPKELETAAFRVIQEALTNIARHAGVQEAAVRLWVDADSLVVQVEDEGTGFDLEAVLGRGDSSGLTGMYERVKLLGGQLHIESAPGSGTHVLARLPLHGSAGSKIDEHFHRLGR